MDENENRLDELVAAVQAGPHYRPISRELVRRIAAQELEKGRSWKETIKATRNKLHQVGGAYQEAGIDYPHWLSELDGLPRSLEDPQVRDFCRRVMQQHASTRERLPILEDFFAQALAPVAPVHSLLDLACGLNPLALPWMPLAEGARYEACDVYSDMVAFINRFFTHVGQPGSADLCDLIDPPARPPVQVALLLKTLPCLEQVDKAVGERLLDRIAAEHLLISFPAQGLGGRSKGMVQNYAHRFADLAAGRHWEIQRFEFATELAFLVSKPA